MDDPHLCQAGLRRDRRLGLRYKTIAFTWVKTTKDGKGFPMGMGYHTRGNPQLCLLAARGKGVQRLRSDVRELIIAPRRQHSQKPDEAYESSNSHGFVNPRESSRCGATSSTAQTVPVKQGSGLAGSLATGTATTLSRSFTTMIILFFLLASGDRLLRGFVEVLPRFKDKRTAVETASDPSAPQNGTLHLDREGP